VKVDVLLDMQARLDGVVPLVRRLEDAGVDGVWSSETAHDPLLPLAVAATGTASATLGTAITVAFARSPMALAYTANDIQQASAGRLVLGLGSQVRPHIARRFSMPWGKPVPQMREYLGALRAIWRCWNEQSPLRFDGEYYRHTLMTPVFSPPPNPFGPPRIVLAAVGSAMTRLAGQAADGLILHPFSTERYLREVTLPAFSAGLEQAGPGPSGAEQTGRPRADVEVVTMGFVVVRSPGVDDDPRVGAVRRQIAFYGSTPAYRVVLDLHGWGALADELNRLSLSADPARWDAMARLIDDEVVAAFAVIGDLPAVARELNRRYQGVVDRIALAPDACADPSALPLLVDAVHAG
jgi:probable F420-dependent oxidoreductase